MRSTRAKIFPILHSPRLAAIVAFSAVWLAAGGVNACEDQAIKRLAALGVDPSQIKGVEVYRESTQEGGLQGYKGWVRLQGCKGHAVIDFDTSCRPYQVYTTGDCRISGLSNC